MTAPFVPIPLFPPYKHWHADSPEDFPENHNICCRLEELDHVKLPFLSLWYCTSFLEAAVHNWPPSRARELYDLVTRDAEKMLNWSYLNGISLRDRDHSEFCNFINFLKQPPDAWCSQTRHSKFVSTPLAPFSEWTFDEKWRLFCRSIDGTNVRIQSRSDLQRSAQIVREFFAYYISTTGIRKDNCAENVPDFILDGMPANTPSLAHLPYELDWTFEQVLNISTVVRRPEQILLYLAMARFSVMNRRHRRHGFLLTQIGYSGGLVKCLYLFMQS